MTQQIFLNQRTLSDIVEHCRSESPFEACGFLVGNAGYLKTVCNFKKAKNQATRINKYIIDPFEYYTLEHSLDGTNLSIIGFYHSHTNDSPYPSRYDIQEAWPGYSYFIVGVMESQEIRIKSWLINSTTGTSDEEVISML